MIPFEKAFADIGSGAATLQSVQEMKMKPENLPPNLIHDMYQNLMNVLGFDEWRGEKLTNQVAVSRLVQILRRILGIESLTDMRTHLLEKAISEIQKTNG